MGSFPMILKFDSLGRYFNLKKTYTFIVFKYLTIVFFLKKMLIFKNKTFTQNHHKLYLSYTSDNKVSFRKSITLWNKPNYDFILGFRLSKLTNLFVHLITFNNEIIFIDYNENYNYLPISQSEIWDRSFKRFYKILKFFKIGAIFFFGMEGKSLFLKRLVSLRILTVSFNNLNKSTLFNYSLPCVSTPLNNYIIYTHFINIFLKYKKY